MLKTPAGTTRRDSLPFSETGSLGDDNTSPVVEFFREEVKEEAPPPPPPRSWLGGLGSYFKPARAPPQSRSAAASASAAGRRLRGRLAAPAARHAAATDAPRARDRLAAAQRS